MGDPWVWVVNEAMSAGRPVIATDAVGAAYDLIQDGVNGYMVPEQDSEALHKALKAVLTDTVTAGKMGAASKKIIDQGFTIDHMVAGFNRAVDSVIAGKKGKVR
jgi:glycosyltransferase involved in cell wall biosynthesis